MTELVLYHGDCVQVMRRLDAESVDAVCTDPPYGLEFMGKEWDKFRVDDRGSVGRPRTGDGVGAQGGFKMGLGGDSTPGVVIGGGRRPTTNRCTLCGKRDQFRKRHYPCGDGRWRAEVIDPHAAPPTSLAFQEWCRVWATEALRVLKPGGHLLAFGGTRTYHRLTSGIEDAGFEIRDTIAWLYGQGFPKNRDVGDLIDEHLGAEREVTRPESRPLEPGTAITFDQRSSSERERRDAPATPQAAAWQGWGTALKPAHEPIVVARKPLRGTVAQTVLDFGTGGLHVDATRVPMTDDDRMRIDTMGGYGKPEWDGAPRVALHDTLNRQTPAAAHELGRHPANVALDEDAAALLDAQSGDMKAGGGRPPMRRGIGYSRGGQGTTSVPVRLDGGGASRFFFKAKGDECDDASIAAARSSPPSEPGDSARNDAATSGSPEAPRSDPMRSAGAASTCEPSAQIPSPDPAPVAVSPDDTDTTPTTASPSSSSGSVPDAMQPSTPDAGEVSAPDLKGTRFFYSAKASTRERNKGLAHLPELFAPTMGDGIGEVPHNPDTARRKANTHPTVKPLDLMHWLVRLVAPPDGVILDPFAGSGTTGVACRLEHVRCILIEADAEYLPIIAGRLGVQATPEGEMRLERTRIPDPEPRKAGRRFACPHCDLAFTDRSLYARHWRSTHDPRRPPTDEGDDDARTD